jgi:hypothetical protein
LASFQKEVESAKEDHRFSDGSQVTGHLPICNSVRGGTSATESLLLDLGTDVATSAWLVLAAIA